MQVFRNVFFSGLKTSSSIPSRKNLSTQITRSFFSKFEVAWKTPQGRLFSNNRLNFSSPRRQGFLMGAKPSFNVSSTFQTMRMATRTVESVNKMVMNRRTFSSQLEIPEAAGAWFEGIPEVAGMFQTAETNYQQQKFLEASKHFGQAISVLRKKKRSPDQQKLFNFIISRFLECHGRVGTLGQLKDFCNDLLKKDVQPGENQLVAILHFGLGDMFLQEPGADLEKAMNHYKRSLDESNQPGVAYKTTFGAYNGIGKAAMLSGKYQEAMDAFDKAVESTTETPVLPQTMAHVHNNRAMVYLMKGELSQCKSAANTALEISEKGDRIEHNELQRALSLLASVARQEGELGTALKMFQRVLESADIVGNKIVRMATLVEMGQINAFMNKVPVAKGLLQEALELSKLPGVDPRASEQIQQMIQSISK